jgi:hypothetical protein
MSDFDHILNWKLLAGSHPFPGPDGGTCINEAAIVACGFPYQIVTSADCMPRCFSRPICQLAMQLNDNATEVQRQRLLPFVTRLACADTPKVERERGRYIDAHLGQNRFFAINAYFFEIDVRFDDGLRVLEGALAIGRQAEPLDVDDAASRLDAARGPAEPTKKRSGILPAKVKSWLGLPQGLENAE